MPGFISRLSILFHWTMYPFLVPALYCFLFLINLLFFLIEGQFLYWILLFSVTPQHETATGIRISPPLWTSLPYPSPSHPSSWIQSPCLSFLSHTANFHWPSILHMVMYVSMLFFPYISPSAALSPCLFLHCCSVNKFFSSIFLDSIYMH